MVTRSSTPRRVLGCSSRSSYFGVSARLDVRCAASRCPCVGVPCCCCPFLRCRRVSSFAPSQLPRTTSTLKVVARVPHTTLATAFGVAAPKILSSWQTLACTRHRTFWPRLAQSVAQDVATHLARRACPFSRSFQALCYSDVLYFVWMTCLQVGVPCFALLCFHRISK